MASSSSQVNLTNLTTYLPLYKAILKGDLETVKRFCHDDPLALEARITENLDSALHVAVGTGMANHIVMYLLNGMSNHQLGLRNSDGDTVLSISAIVGNTRAAMMIVNKHPNLLQIANHDGRLPLLEAACHGQKEMISYLLEVGGDMRSLFSSVAAILMFLTILTARYAEADFLYTLPKRLIFGLVTLFLSITSMMAAFSSPIFLVFCSKKAWMLIPVAALACLPISLFASLQFPLLVDMINSTYKPRMFGKKNKCTLH